MKPIKLDEISCGGRINGMGEADPEGSYIAVTCVEDGNPGEPPQSLTFSISEGQAETLVAEIKGALMRAYEGESPKLAARDAERRHDP